jgi:hypothetical protein
MKTFSNLINNICESKQTKQTKDKKCCDINNNCCQQQSIGVTNHLTPVENIVVNVRNLFCAMLGIVAEIAEDGVSIKLHSSQFVNDKATYNVLYQTLYNSQSLYSYITSQGLDCCKLVNLGQYIVVYFCPSDIKTSVCNTEGEFMKPDCVPCKEMLEANIDEAELDMIYENEDDEEIKDIRNKQITEIIDLKDKVKAAKLFAAYVGTQITLPMEYYFTGVKSKDGEESIALRWRYTKRRPHNKSAEITKSLLNIFGSGKEGVWVGDFDKNSLFNLPDEVKKLIESILELLDAEKTSDPCVFSIDNDDTKKEKEEEKKKKEEEEKNNKSEEDDKTEDDKSRGHDSDNESDSSDDLLKI